MKIAVHRLALPSAGALCLAALAGCGEQAAPPSLENARLAAEAPVLPPEMARPTRDRILALVSVKHALDLYATGHGGGYPPSEGWQGMGLDKDEFSRPSWVMWLVGRYISAPPGQATASFLYLSDGRNFKLIASETGDCSPSVEVAGIRADPKRSDASGCRAYGYWSPGGEAF